MSDNVWFGIWSSWQVKSKNSQREVLNKLVAREDVEVSEDSIKQAFAKESENVQDSEILEKVEKRFGKSLPLDCINVILLMEF